MQIIALVLILTLLAPAAPNRSIWYWLLPPNLQSLIDNAQCGDTIKLPLGDYIGNFRLRNKGCTASNEIRITTEGFNVPGGQRVQPSDDAQMARILTPGNGLPAIETDAGASHYKLIGIFVSVEYTMGHGSTSLITIGSGDESNPGIKPWLSHDITFDRCHIAGKFNDSAWAFMVSGERLTLINSRVDEFAGGRNTMTGGLLFTNAGGHLLENNFISGGMYQFMAGGADPDSPNRATITNVTLNSATVSNVEGTPLKVGDLIPFFIRRPYGNWQPNTDYNLNQPIYEGIGWREQPVMYYAVKAGRSGTTKPNLAALDEYHNQTLTDGTVTWRLFNGWHSTGRVTKVEGNQITWEWHGPSGVPLVPVEGSLIKWNGHVPSVTSRRNHYFRPAAWAAFDAPNKGMFQIKCGQNITWEGDFFEVEKANVGNDDYRPGLISLTPGNQSYGAPWCTARGITVRYNRARHVKDIFNWSLNDYTKTALLGGNNIAHDNLFEDVLDGFALVTTGFNVALVHNTVLNQRGKPLMLFGQPKVDGMVYRDNIVGWYGGPFLEFGDLFLQNVTGASFEGGNVFIDVNNRSGEGYPPTKYFPNSHIAGTWTDVKIQSDGRLAPDSLFKGRGSDGKDPGADIDLIEAAMAGNLPQPDPTPTPSPSPLPSPTVTPSPSPSPTPATSTRLLNGYVKVNGVYFNGTAVVTSSAGQTFTTQPGGYFELQNVPLGSALSASAPGYTFPTVTVDMAPYFIIDGSSVASPTPTPLPSPSPSPTATPTPSPTPTPLPSPTPGATPRCLKFHPKTNQCQKWSI